MGRAGGGRGPAPWREWSLAAAGGRRSPALVWEVRNAGGERFRLSGIQRSVLSYAVAQHAAGRHRWTVRGCAEALGCSPSSVSRAVSRLRSLSLLGSRRPARGRLGHVLSWVPSPAAAARDRAGRRVRWPTRAGLSGNVATLTSYAGYISREGLRRAFRAASAGSPPGARPPRGGPAPDARVRARGRPWPPPHVDERCPSTGRRERLPLRLRVVASPDEALVYAGRGARCRAWHAAAVVLARPGTGPGRPSPAPSDPGAWRPAAPPPGPASPGRAEAAAAVLPLLGPELADRVRVDHLGWLRQALREPALPALATAGPEGPDALVADLERRCRAELAEVAASRRPVPPEG